MKIQLSFLNANTFKTKKNVIRNKIKSENVNKFGGMN